MAAARGVGKLESGVGPSPRAPGRAPGDLSGLRRAVARPARGTRPRAGQAAIQSAPGRDRPRGTPGWTVARMVPGPRELPAPGSGCAVRVLGGQSVRAAIVIRRRL